MYLHLYVNIHTDRYVRMYVCTFMFIPVRSQSACVHRHTCKYRHTHLHALPRPHMTVYCFVCLFCCFMSQVNSYGHGGTVNSPNHTFSWASLYKKLTSTSCTYFRLYRHVSKCTNCCIVIQCADVTLQIGQVYQNLITSFFPSNSKET